MKIKGGAKVKDGTSIIDLQGFSVDDIVEQEVQEILSISVLKEYRPSNRLPVQVKGDRKSEDMTELVARVKNVDKVKGLVYAIPMIANVVDTDGDYYSNKNVKDIAHKTMRTKVATYISDIDHDYKMRDDISLVESHVDESDAKHHAWNVCLDVSKNEELMSDIENLEGVSIWAFMTPKSKSKKSEKGMIGKLLDILKGATRENYETANIIGDIYQATRSFFDGVVEWDEKEMKEVIKVKTQEEYLENVEELNSILKSIVIKTKSNQEKAMTPEELIELLNDESVQTKIKEIVTPAEEGETEDEKAEREAQEAEDAKNEEEKAKKAKEDLDEKIKAKDDEILELKKKLKLKRETDDKSLGGGDAHDFNYYMKNLDEWNKLDEETQKGIREEHIKSKKK